MFFMNSWMKNEDREIFRWHRVLLEKHINFMRIIFLYSFFYLHPARSCDDAEHEEEKNIQNLIIILTSQDHLRMFSFPIQDRQRTKKVSHTGFKTLNKKKSPILWGSKCCAHPSEMQQQRSRQRKKEAEEKNHWRLFLLPFVSSRRLRCFKNFQFYLECEQAKTMRKNCMKLDVLLGKNWLLSDLAPKVLRCRWSFGCRARCFDVKPQWDRSEMITELPSAQ